jgi:hypothetical protein
LIYKNVFIIIKAITIYISKMEDTTIYVKKRRGKKAKAKKAAAKAARKAQRAKKPERLPRSVRALLGYMEGSQMKIGGQSSLSRVKLAEFQRFATQKQLPPAPMQVQPEIYRVYTERDVAQKRQQELQGELQGVQTQLQATQTELAPLRRAMTQAVANPFPARMVARAESESTEYRNIYGSTPLMSQRGSFAHSYEAEEIPRFQGLQLDVGGLSEYRMFAGAPYDIHQPIPRGTGFSVGSDRMSPRFESPPRRVAFNQPEYVGGGGGAAMSYGDDQEGAFNVPSDYRMAAGAPFQVDRSAGFQDYMERVPTGRVKAVDKLYREPKARRPLPSRKKAPQTVTLVSPGQVSPTGFAVAGGGGGGENAAEFRRRISAQLGLQQSAFKSMGIPIRSASQRGSLQSQIENLRAGGKNSSQIIEVLKQQQSRQPM